jgi:peptidoglycan/LPS O-acetylase OafA/YrhL
LLIREEHQTGGVRLKNFFIRRVIRIVPPAYFYIAIITVLAAAGLAPLPWKDLQPSLLFYVDYLPTSHLTGHYWTLSVEEQFYLLWPLAFVALRTNRSRLLAATLMILAAPIWRQMNIVWAGQAGSLNWFRFDLRYDSLLAGCLLASLMQWERADRVLESRWLSSDLSTICVTLALVLSFTGIVEAIPRIAPILSTFRVACVAIVVNRVVRAPRGWIVPLLEFPPIAWLGRLSYSIYLWQQLFTTDLPAAPWLAPRFPLNLVSILLAGMVSYYLVEKPLQSLRTRLRRPEPTPMQHPNLSTAVNARESAWRRTTLQS